MAVVEIQFPGNIAQVDTAADLRAIPSYGVQEGTLYVVLGLGRAYDFSPSSLATDDGTNVIKPNDRSPLQAGRWIYAVNGFGPGPAGPPGPAMATFDTLATFKAAPISNQTQVLKAPGVAPGTFLWTTGNFTGQADDQNIIKADSTALTVGAWVRQQAAGVLFVAAEMGAVARAVSNKLEEGAISVMDFMTEAQRNNARNNLGTIDCSAAFNQAFQQATVLRRSVYIPDGVYQINAPLLFGTQNISSQSASPQALLGQSKLGTILRAGPSLTGTLLQSWSLAGIAFQDFTIETIGTNVMAWDCRWRAGAGPSTQCIFRHILVTGGTAPVHVNWDDMNDSYPTDVTVRVNDPMASTCGISMVQSGGLSIMRGCIWSNCYLRFGCQNGEINGCWGHGIEFASNSTNYVNLTGWYGYANPTKGAVTWSQAFGPGQSVKALTMIACQFITEVDPVASYFDLNIYSQVKILGCQFIGPTAALMGPNTRRDAISRPIIDIEGGSHSGSLVLTDNDQYESQAMAFVNDLTGRMVTKNRQSTFNPVVTGVGAYTIQSGRWHRVDNRVFFNIRLAWTGYSGGAAPIVITGLPFLNAGPAEAVTIGYPANTFAGSPAYAQLGASSINFYGPSGGSLNVPADGDVQLSGSYQVDA